MSDNNLPYLPPVIMSEILTKRYDIMLKNKLKKIMFKKIKKFNEIYELTRNNLHHLDITRYLLTNEDDCFICDTYMDLYDNEHDFYEDYEIIDYILQLTIVKIISRNLQLCRRI
jgi:hypothetical protein